jgi:hypothetical protein
MFWQLWAMTPFWKLWGRKSAGVAMNTPGIDDTKDLGPKKNILILFSNTNRLGRKDATGAFIPEARAFMKCHAAEEVHFVGLDLEHIPRGARRSAVYQAIHDATLNRKLDAIVFYGHGWPDGIQFGFSRENVPDLAEVLADNSQNTLKVSLYACLAAENDVIDKEHGDVGPGTDGGFADVLRDALVRCGICKGWVDAHKTKGHTTWNPYMVRFLCEDTTDPDYDGEGGAWIVAPRSEHWKVWCRRLRGKKDNLRHEFPFLTELAVKLKLSGLS